MFIKKSDSENEKSKWKDIGSALAGNNAKDFHAVTLSKFYYLDKNKKAIERCNFCEKRLTEKRFKECLSENFPFSCNKCTNQYGREYIQNTMYLYRCRNCGKITQTGLSKTSRKQGIRAPIGFQKKCDCTLWGKTYHSVKIVARPKIKIKK